MTGEQWMAEKLKEFTLLASAGPSVSPEKLGALLDLVGGDHALFEQVTSGLRTKAARASGTFLDGVSDYLVARRGSPQCQ